MFTLHPQLLEDSVLLGELPLCQVLLMDNAFYPWLILVPKVENAREITDLPLTHYPLLWEEVRKVAEILMHFFAPDKLNIASLGNVVPQLHVHLVARFNSDKTWPDPVWGKDKPRIRYADEQKAQLIPKLQAALESCEGFTLIGQMAANEVRI